LKKGATAPEEERRVPPTPILKTLLEESRAATKMRKPNGDSGDGERIVKKKKKTGCGNPSAGNANQKNYCQKNTDGGA